MNELILTSHIFIGILSIVLTFGLYSNIDFFSTASTKLHSPSLLLVVISGFGLIITGSSLTRTCISGAVFLAAVVAIKYLAATKIAKVQDNKI